MKKEYLHGVQFFRTSDWPSAYLAMTLSARVPYNETVMCVPFQNGQTLDHILSHLDPIHTKKNRFLKPTVRLFSHLLVRLPEALFPLGFSINTS